MYFFLFSPKVINRPCYFTLIIFFLRWQEYFWITKPDNLTYIRGNTSHLSFCLCNEWEMIKEEIVGPRAGHKHSSSPLRELVIALVIEGLPFFEIRKPVLLSVASGLWIQVIVSLLGWHLGSWVWVITPHSLAREMLEAHIKVILPSAWAVKGPSRAEAHFQPAQDKCILLSHCTLGVGW